MALHRQLFIFFPTSSSLGVMFKIFSEHRHSLKKNLDKEKGVRLYLSSLLISTRLPSLNNNFTVSIYPLEQTTKREDLSLLKRVNQIPTFVVNI